MTEDITLNFNLWNYNRRELTFMLNDVFGWIMMAIISIVNIRKLFGTNLPIKHKVLLFISGTICYVIFGAYVYHTDKLGHHDVLFEGRILDGRYFVVRQGSAPLQISEWDYQLNLMLGIATYVSFIIHAILSALVFWEH